jgi:hypothetical protein
MSENQNPFGTSSAPGTGESSTGSDISTNVRSMESHTCTTCGEQHTPGSEASFEKLLGRLGLSEEAITRMRGSIENLDLESYFNQAKDYLGKQATKARDYAKDNKKVIAGALGVVAVAAGVLIAMKNRSGDDDRDRV